VHPYIHIYKYIYIHILIPHTCRLRRFAVDAEDEPKVVILVEDGVGLVVCELGVLKSGAAFVPVDPNWPPERWAARVLLLIFSEVSSIVILQCKLGSVLTFQNFYPRYPNWAPAKQAFKVS